MSTQDKSQTTVGVSDGVLGPFTPLVENFAAYLIDAAQRSILFWDVMRQRSNHSRSVFGQNGAQRNWPTNFSGDLDFGLRLQPQVFSIYHHWFVRGSGKL